jgi:hypothetical protein
MRTTLAAVIAASATITTACSSSAHPAKSVTEPHPRSSASTPVSTTNTLTGFGATRARWNEHHDANQDPRLDTGCCYGPPVEAPGNGGTTDTWNIAAAGDPINMLTHNFAPRTTRDEALAAITSQDLPPDAEQVSSKMGEGCELLLFHSAQLAAADPELGHAISMGLYSASDATVFDPADVEQAILSDVDELGDC